MDCPRGHTYDARSTYLSIKSKGVDLHISHTGEEIKAKREERGLLVKIGQLMVNTE